MSKSRPLKVLHVAPLPPPLGGMVTYIQGLLNSDVFKSVNYKVVRLNYFNKEKFTGVLRVLMNILNAFILTAVFLFKTITFNPEIVHIQANSGFGFFEKSWIAFLAKLFGKITIFHFHGGNLRGYFDQSSHFAKTMIRKCILINDRIMTGSPQMRETWLYIGVPNEKIVHINNAVNLPDISDRKPHHGVSLLFLTRIILQKGIIELIDAYLELKKSYSDLKLRIVGANTMDTSVVLNYLLEHDKDQQITFVGPVSDEQKHQEYLMADIFAFPTYVEDQSYAVMEAMSYQLPCVASNVGGVPSLIQDGQNGILCEPRSVESLVYHLDLLIKDSNLREKLAQNARSTIERDFTWNKRSQEILDLYRDLINNKQHKKIHERA